MAGAVMRETCKCAILESGAMCVVTVGTITMLKSSVVNWATPLQVIDSIRLAFKLFINCVLADYRYAISRRSSYYGYGTGRIWLDYMYCSGSETALLSCNKAYSLGTYYCNYGGLAGAYCHCMQ